MGWFSIGRAFARGIVKVVKQTGPLSQNGCAPAGVLNQASLLHQVKVFGFRQVSLNFRSTSPAFYYNNLAAHLRRKASQNFLQRNVSKFPLLAFAGFYLTDANCKKEKEATISSLLGHLTCDLDKLWKEDNTNTTVFPSNFSEYAVGERLGKPSSNAAVYSADFNGNEVALKIMFNYNVPSNTAAISQAFESEYQVLPCTDVRSDDVQSDEIVDISCNTVEKEEVVLDEHPYIMKLHRKFVDETPLLHDSIESYPMAVPSRHHHNGNGRNRTMCLVMPRYTSSLREFLHENKDTLTTEQRIAIFGQLLEGVGHLEQRNVAHRDLKSDNVLINRHDDGSLHVVLTDFGCCLVEKDMLLPYYTVHTDRGGNFALLAPEIANAVPSEGLYLDYSKADAWTCGAIAYEIFDQDNPFYVHLRNTTYENEVVKEIPVYSGYPMIDKVVRGLLQKKPNDRLSACQASTIMFLITNAPPEWFIFPSMVTEMEIERWLLILSINTRRGIKLDGDQRFLPPDILLKLLCLSRITPSDVLIALQTVRKLRSG